jgi:hypothetical protein
MVDDPEGDEAPGRQKRFIVEIERWNWGLHVGVSSPFVPIEHRFQQGLMYARGIDIEGRVRAPRAQNDEPIEVWITPLGPEMGGPDVEEVGQFRGSGGSPLRPALQVNLRLPEEALASSLTCLGSTWRYLLLWITENPGDRASVTAFSFVAKLPIDLGDWAG